MFYLLGFTGENIQEQSEKKIKHRACLKKTKTSFWFQFLPGLRVATQIEVCAFNQQISY